MKKIIALLLSLLASNPAQAQLGLCTTVALPVSFGNYNPFNASPLDTTGQVTVSCNLLVGLSLGISYTIKLSAGESSSFSNRELTLLSNKLQYNLYTSNARTTVLGDGTGGSSTISDSYLLGLLGAVRNYTVYARLHALQNKAGGLYTDTIVVTVDY